MGTKARGGRKVKGNALLERPGGGVGLCWDPSQLGWEQHGERGAAGGSPGEGDAACRMEQSRGEHAARQGDK